MLRDSGFTINRFQASGLGCFFGQDRFQGKILEEGSQAGAEKTEQAKKERDKAKHKAKVACLAAIVAGEAKARAEDDMARM